MAIPLQNLHFMPCCQQRLKNPFPHGSLVLHHIGFERHAGFQGQAFAIGGDVLVFQLHLDAVQRLLGLRCGLQRCALAVGQVLRGRGGGADALHLAQGQAKLLVGVGTVAHPHGLPGLDEACGAAGGIQGGLQFCLDRGVAIGGQQGGHGLARLDGRSLGQVDAGEHARLGGHNDNGLTRLVFRVFLRQAGQSPVQLAQVDVQLALVGLPLGLQALLFSLQGGSIALGVFDPGLQVDQFLLLVLRLDV